MRNSYALLRKVCSPVILINLLSMRQLDFLNFVRYHFAASGCILISLYVAVLAVIIALLALVITIPCLLISIEVMHNEFDKDF